MGTSDQVTLRHGGAYEITLSRSGERGLVVEVFDMEEDASSVAPMTPEEWDCFVARGNKALGRGEQAPTVPRAAVEAFLPLLAGVSLMLDASDDKEAKREAVRRLDRMVVALGRLTTEPTTLPEKG